jgi:hypothetical protein
MTREFSRRRFLASATAASLAMAQPGIAWGHSSAKAGKTLDIHVHLFGTSDSRSGCILSKTITDGPVFEFLAGKLKPHLERAKTFDEGYVLAMAEYLEKSSLDKGVILAQDAVYDRNGKPDWGRTNFYVPNDYLFQVVDRYRRLCLSTRQTALRGRRKSVVCRRRREWNGVQLTSRRGNVIKTWDFRLSLR